MPGGPSLINEYELQPFEVQHYLLILITLALGTALQDYAK